MGFNLNHLQEQRRKERNEWEQRLKDRNHFVGSPALQAFVAKSVKGVLNVIDQPDVEHCSGIETCNDFWEMFRFDESQWLNKNELILLKYRTRLSDWVLMPCYALTLFQKEI